VTIFNKKIMMMMMMMMMKQITHHCRLFSYVDYFVHFYRMMTPGNTAVLRRIKLDRPKDLRT